MDNETREAFRNLRESMDARFDKMDERLDAQDKILEKICNQTDGTDARLGALEHRVSVLENAS